MKNNRQKRAKDRGKANESRLVHKLNAYYLDDVPLNAKRVPLSGALADEKGDILIPMLELLAEAKVYGVQQAASGARYIRLDLDWHAKIRREADGRGLKHAVVIVRGERLSQDYVIITLEEYLELRGISMK